MSEKNCVTSVVSVNLQEPADVRAMPDGVLLMFYDSNTDKVQIHTVFLSTAVLVKCVEVASQNGGPFASLLLMSEDSVLDALRSAYEGPSPTNTK